ncbi:MAG: hypothetical protein EOO89_21770 [Pedobacter sp.]|nr:MAG: hypothetical protein EOO89_21770 [Pedobacter sp.]
MSGSYGYWADDSHSDRYSVSLGLKFVHIASGNSGGGPQLYPIPIRLKWRNGLKEKYTHSWILQPGGAIKQIDY